MPHYDVFISFKNTDEFGQETLDSKMAKELFLVLKANNINAFFSSISIHEEGSDNFSKAIDKALEECSILVAVGTKKEHFEANWVSYEIDTFKVNMLDNNKPIHRSAIVSYVSKDIIQKDLPTALKSKESFHELDKLVNFISKKLKQDEHFPNEIIAIDNKSPISITETHSPIEFGQEQHKNDVVGTLIDRRYKILTKIGRGGMSVIYLALDTKLAKEVAIKEVSLKHSVKDFEIIKYSILTETNLLKKLDHPLLPRIHDIIESTEQIYVIMDYIEGNTLNRQLNEIDRFSESMVLNIARQLCDILNYLHSRKPPIIYRDLKPANIIIQPNSNIKLIDFGTAREYKKNNLADTTCLGTVGFAAPEQFGGMGQTDARTDIYALGVTLYNLLTGLNPCEPPYEIKPILEYNPDVSLGMEYIIKKCVERDPDKRFQSATEVLDALDNIDKISKKLRYASIFKRVFSWLTPKPTIKINSKEKPVTDPMPIVKPSPTPTPISFPIPFDISVSLQPVSSPSYNSNNTDCETNLLNNSDANHLMANSTLNTTSNATVLLLSQQDLPPLLYRNLETLAIKTKGIKFLLSEQIFGQEAVVDEFITAYFRTEMNLILHEKTSPGPYATFLFLGPQGVGKCFFAKNIAKVFQYPSMHFTMQDIDNIANKINNFVSQFPKSLLLFDYFEEADFDTLQNLKHILNSELISLSQTMIVFSSNIQSLDDFPEPLRSFFAPENVFKFKPLSAHMLRNIGKRVILSKAHTLETKLGIRIEVDENIFSTLLYHSKEKPSSSIVKQTAINFFTQEVYETLRFGIINTLNEEASKFHKIHIYVDIPETDTTINSLFDEEHLTQICNDLYQSGKHLVFQTKRQCSNNKDTIELVLTDLQLVLQDTI